MSERIAIVGASVRAAAASAVRSGLQPVAADRFGDDDLRRIAPTTQIADYPDGLLDWLQQLDPKPAAWMYTGGLENHPELIDAMAAHCPLWGNSGSVLRDVRSPWRLAEVLQAADLGFPEIRRSAEDLPRDGSWLAKTGRGASGTGVGVLAAENSEKVDAFFQRCVDGVKASAVFVASGGKAQLLGVVRQLVGEPWLGATRFQYCGAIAPLGCNQAVDAEVARIGRTIASEFRLCGLFGVDLIIGDERVWTIEVNPRYPASTEVIEWTTGLSAIALHRRAFTGDCSSSIAHATSKETSSYAGKAILFAKSPVTVHTCLAHWESLNTNSSWPLVADLSPVGTSINVGAPIMSVFASGGSMEKIEEQLRVRVAEIERSLYS